MNGEAMDTRRLGEDGGPISLEGLADHRDAVDALLEQASRSVHIYTRDLESPLYDAPAIERALSRLARRSRHSHVHIIVQDSTRAVKQGHRLVTLAQRLSSHVQIRNPAPEHMDENGAFLIVDGTALLRRNLADRYKGMVDFNDRLAARELDRYFREVWEHGRPDPQLRRLLI